MRPIMLAALGALCLGAPSAPAEPARDLRRTALRSPAASDEIVRLDIDGDGRPDILERWWNGKRVRWLDENGDLRPTDTRGDMVADVLQVDMNGDGVYDGVDRPERQVGRQRRRRPRRRAGLVHAAAELGARQVEHGRVALDAVPRRRPGRRPRLAGLADVELRQLELGLHRYRQLAARLPRRRPLPEDPPAAAGAARPAPQLGEPVRVLRLSTATASPRWRCAGSTRSSRSRTAWRRCPACSTRRSRPSTSTTTPSKGNEIDFDMSLRGAGGPGVPYRVDGDEVPGAARQPEVRRAASSGATGGRSTSSSTCRTTRAATRSSRAGWTSMYMVFDEDDDDHRWERVEMYYPMHGFGGPEDIDIWSTKTLAARATTRSSTWSRRARSPASAGHPQADSLGDRGEFDRDNSGGGKLYVGVFDRKLHLAGAEWGAWTVDRNGEYHGGWKTPSPKPLAPKVEEVVRYTDTDGNGFLDTRGVRLRRRPHASTSRCRCSTTRRRAVRRRTRLRSSTPARRAGRACTTLFTHDREPVVAGGARRLPRRVAPRAHDARDGQARQRRRRWPSATRMPTGSRSTRFRQIRARLAEVRRGRAGARRAALDALEKDLVRLYYLGRFDDYVRRIAEVPGR